MTGAAIPATPVPPQEPVAEFAAIGIQAFTTTRAAGDFGLEPENPRPEALARWHALSRDLAPVAARLASARQVHGTRMLEHDGAWEGWLRVDGADAHLLRRGGIAAAVTVADCIPVFIAHPSGLAAIVHAGWRGTAGRILERALERVRELGYAPEELRVHLGPGICGRCYQVGPDVYEQLTGWKTVRNRHVDLRALLAEQARDLGVRALSASAYCTRCDNDRFFSHRAGDTGRQVAVIVSR